MTNCDAIRLLVLGEDLILHQIQTLNPNSSAMRIREIIEVKDGSCAEYRRSFLSHQKVLSKASKNVCQVGILHVGVPSPELPSFVPTDGDFLKEGQDESHWQKQRKCLETLEGPPVLVGSNGFKCTMSVRLF